MVGAEEGMRVMPWTDWSEWLDLRKMLINGDSDTASARVAMYRTRRRSAVPIEMLSTVALRQQLENPSPDSYLQRLALSMSITRLVNGVTDRIQPRAENATARSVAYLAGQLQLPLILVEIRHQASHNALPRLTLLNSSARQALNWLEYQYWKPQERIARLHVNRGFEDVKNVFQPDDTERAEVGVTKFQKSEMKNGLPSLPHEPAGSSDGVRLLQKMNDLEAHMKRKLDSRARLQLLENDCGLKGDSTWELCNNKEAWKKTSLGLVPGQTRVPRLPYEFVRLEKKTRGTKYPRLDLKSGWDASDSQSSVHVDATGGFLQAEGTKDDDTNRFEQFKKARVLSEEELAYAAKKKAEYVALAKLERAV